MAGVVEVDYPAMSPGICMICTSGHTEDRRWFDLMVSPWKMGRLYICSLCVVNLANLLEINPNQELQKRIEALEVENVQGRNALGILGNLRIAFDAMDLESVVDEPVITERIKGAKEPAA